MRAIYSAEDLVYRYAELREHSSSTHSSDPCEKWVKRYASLCGARRAKKKPPCKSHFWYRGTAQKGEDTGGDYYVRRCCTCNRLWPWSWNSFSGRHKGKRSGYHAGTDAVPERMTDLATLERMLHRRPTGRIYKGVTAATWLFYRVCYGLHLEGFSYRGVARLGTAIWSSPTMANLDELPVLRALIGDLKRWPSAPPKRWTPTSVELAIAGPRRCRRVVGTTSWPGIAPYYKRQIDIRLQPFKEAS